jgi:hypothetical protein
LYRVAFEVDTDVSEKHAAFIFIAEVTPLVALPKPHGVIEEGHTTVIAVEISEQLVSI